MDNLYFNEIAIFIKVAEMGSFVKASDSLGIPTTTVSRKIYELEEKLGICLLHRTTRKIRLTEIGKIYFDHCSKSINDLYSTNQFIKNSSLIPRGKIKISSSIEFGEEILSNWIIKFQKKYPEIQFELILDNKYLDFFDNNIDISFRAGKVGNSTNFKLRKICSIPYILCATKNYLSINGYPKNISDLESHKCIMVSSYNHPIKWQFVNNKEKKSESVTINNSILKTNNLTVAKKFALSDFGIAFLPNFIVKDSIENNDLIKILDIFEPISREIYALYPTSKQTISNIKLFIDFILNLKDKI